MTTCPPWGRQSKGEQKHRKGARRCARVGHASERGGRQLRRARDRRPMPRAARVRSARRPRGAGGARAVRRRQLPSADPRRRREAPAVPIHCARTSSTRHGQRPELRAGGDLLDELRPRPGLPRALRCLVRTRLSCACTRGAGTLLGTSLRTRGLRGRRVLLDRLRLARSPHLGPHPTPRSGVGWRTETHGSS